VRLGARRSSPATAGAPTRAPSGEVGQRPKISIGVAKRGTQIVRESPIDGVEVDDLVALNEAETRPVSGFESDNFHEWILLERGCTLTGSLADFSRWWI
jgi:hypothetical protein